MALFTLKCFEIGERYTARAVRCAAVLAVGSRQITTNNFLILLFDRKSGGVIKSKDKPTDVQQLTRLGQAARLVTTKVNL